MKIAVYEQRSFFHNFPLSLKGIIPEDHNEDPHFNTNILDAPTSTHFYFVIDTTSIKANQITAIENAITGLNPLLRDMIFNGDQAKADSQIHLYRSTVDTTIITSGNENWVGWFNDLYQPEAVYYFFLDETESAYHKHNLQGDNYTVTAKYNSDFNTFKTNYSSRNFFVSRVYHVGGYSNSNSAFREHLINAYFGLYGHEAVYDYFVEARLDLNSLNVTSKDYLDDFLRLTQLGTRPEEL